MQRAGKKKPKTKEKVCLSGGFHHGFSVVISSIHIVYVTPFLSPCLIRLFMNHLYGIASTSHGLVCSLKTLASGSGLSCPGI